MISGINSNSAVAGTFQRPPMGAGYKLSDDQKNQLQEILSKYDSENASDEDMQSMMEEIKKAGIRPGEDLKNAVEGAGFQMKPPQGGPPPMGGPGGPGRAGAEPPQFVKNFMDKVESGDISEDDLSQFIKTVQSQHQQYTGVLFDQTA